MFTYLCITVKCESGYWAFNKEQGADAGRRLLDYCVPQNIVDISTLHSRHKKWFYSLHVRRVGQSRTRASVSCTVYSVQYRTLYSGGPAGARDTSCCIKWCQMMLTRANQCQQRENNNYGHVASSKSKHYLTVSCNFWIFHKILFLLIYHATIWIR